VKILVVEDHRDVAEMTMLVLEQRFGFEALWAATGAEAIEAARQSEPDLMLIDINLPDISGYELVRELRADPRFAKTTMIALSGFSEASDRAAALDAGFNAFYTKPMDLGVLESEHARAQGQEPP
jgi:CheY-like chemotaxis protein